MFEGFWGFFSNGDNLLYSLHVAHWLQNLSKHGHYFRTVYRQITTQVNGQLKAIFLKVRCQKKVREVNRSRIYIETKTRVFAAYLCRSIWQWPSQSLEYLCSHEQPRKLIRNIYIWLRLNLKGHRKMTGYDSTSSSRSSRSTSSSSSCCSTLLVIKNHKIACNTFNFLRHERQTCPSVFLNDPNCYLTNIFEI